MTTSISSSGSVSSTGIGSGLDVNSIIDGLMKVEKAPLTALQTKATAIQSTISAFGAVQSAMASFRDAAATLALPSTWSASTGTSSDPTAVSVTAQAGAAAGSYAVQVQALAAAQSVVSGTPAASSGALVGAGTLHVELGTWAGTPAAFTPQTGRGSVAVVVTATDTLATLASKVNAAGTGVTASVVNDTSGSRLLFSSGTTGVANGFRVTATDADGGDTDANGLSAFAYDPAGGTTGTTLTQPASNARASVNGLVVNSATNNLVNVFDGLTLNLSKVTPSAVQVNVAQDTSATKASVQSFVTAYNALSTLLSTDLKYDSGTQVAGPLQADSAAVGLQHQLRTAITSSSSASTAFSSLSQVGLEIQTDGTLKLNDTKLTAAMGNAAELKKLFTRVDSGQPGNNGVATNLRTLGNTLLGSTGVLTARIAGLNTTLGRNQKDQATLSDRLADTEARLKKQYTALDAKMSSISTLSNYVTQQIANWNKSTR